MSERSEVDAKTWLDTIKFEIYGPPDTGIATEDAISDAANEAAELLKQRLAPFGCEVRTEF